VSAAGPRIAVTRGTVVLDAERCKGCGLCIPACRPNVLEMGTTMNSAGFTMPELRPGCTGCMACAEICPDFALEVWKFEEPIVRDPSGTQTRGED
jgi:2-oxoglutarate ferredoxin oxidoreductase subunit delta